MNDGMTESRIRQSINSREVLPLLVSTYTRGHLVPFLGAGMSTPMLTLWEPFVARLEQQATERGVAVGHAPFEESPDALVQRTCARIKNSLGHAGFLECVRHALQREGGKVPDQTMALAAIRWPLVISTNYDDLFFGAVCSHNQEGDPAPVLAGRSALDCKRIMSSLSGPFGPAYIWHVQGFLGGQYPGLARPLPDPLTALNHELVIGHAEYQAVTSGAPYFRRCFGEVFRSRSFLFLGSSLTEDYFRNLFGEVLQLVGPSPVPHFAVTLKNTLDRHFLADQMNIVVCELNDWGDLPRWLEDLGNALEKPSARTAHVSIALRGTAETESYLDILCGSAPKSLTAHDEAIAMVARRTPTGQPEIVDQAQRQYFGYQFADVKFGDKHVARSPEGNYYAVTARLPDGADSAVDNAVRELLQETTRHKCQLVHLQLPPKGNVPPVYAFIETVRTFGRWKREHPHSDLRLKLYVLPEVIHNLTADRINIHELLTSGLIRFWTSVAADASEEPARRVLYYHPDTPFQTVLDDLDVQPSNDWSVSLTPSPRWSLDAAEERTASALRQKTLLQIGVVFGSELTLQRKTPS
jgi:hypothetical protein